MVLHSMESGLVHFASAMESLVLCRVDFDSDYDKAMYYVTAADTWKPTSFSSSFLAHLLYTNISAMLTASKKVTMITNSSHVIILFWFERGTAMLSSA